MHGTYWKTWDLVEKVLSSIQTYTKKEEGERESVSKKWGKVVGQGKGNNNKKRWKNIFSIKDGIL